MEGLDCKRTRAYRWYAVHMTQRFNPGLAEELR
jgi:hypothetical protein